MKSPHIRTLFRLAASFLLALMALAALPFLPVTATIIWLFNGKSFRETLREGFEFYGLARR